MVLLENHKFRQNFDYLPKIWHFFHFFGTNNGNYIIFPKNLNNNNNQRGAI